MSEFRRVTGINQVWYLNLDDVSSMYRDEKHQQTFITYKGDIAGEHYVRVKETPEELLQL